MIGSIIIPNGQVFIERPFECFFDKKTKQVTVSGGKVIPIYSRQRSFKVENEGDPITLSSLQEVYLHLKTTPLTNEIETARFVTDEDVKMIKERSDSALNMFLPVCRYDENLDRIDDSFFNSNFNYTRQRGDEPLRGYYDGGNVYINGFILNDQIPNSLLGQRVYGPKIIKANNGDFIVANISVLYRTNSSQTSEITYFSIEKGTPLLPVETTTEDTSTGTDHGDHEMVLTRKYPIGYVNNGSYVSLFTGNIFVSISDYEAIVTPYENTVEEVTTTQYTIVRKYSIEL